MGKMENFGTGIANPWMKSSRKGRSRLQRISTCPICYGWTALFFTQSLNKLHFSFIRCRYTGNHRFKTQGSRGFARVSYVLIN
jgi:hypothetical protein